MDTVSRKALELALLKLWTEHDFKEIYKYKNRINWYRREGLARIELFYDVTHRMFADVEDTANGDDLFAEDCKVSVESLIRARSGPSTESEGEAIDKALSNTLADADCGDCLHYQAEIERLRAALEEARNNMEDALSVGEERHVFKPELMPWANLIDGVEAINKALDDSTTSETAVQPLSWIDINDSLPNHNEIVLICWRDGIDTGYVQNYGDGKLGAVRGRISAHFDDIVCWMPLPPRPGIKDGREGG